jgi:hypothetical protein
MRYSIIAFSAILVFAASFSINANVAFACTRNDQCESGVCNFSTDECVAPVTGQTQIIGGPNTGVRLVNPLGDGMTLNSFLLSILKIVTETIGPVVVILMLVYVGFLFVAAQGNSTKISAAREMLLWTVVGALILLGAVAIAKGIEATVQALSTG